MNLRKSDVADLLENFADYKNLDRKWDPWFQVDEINQQFAWGDVPEETLVRWLGELEAEGKVTHGEDGWRWLP